MKKDVQSWFDILKYMIDKPKTTSLAILYPISRTKLATTISNAALEIDLKAIKLEVNPAKEFETVPKNLAFILDNLTEDDFLIVLRGDNFINKLKLNNHFNTFSGLINSGAKSLVLHMLISDKNLTYLSSIDYEELLSYTVALRKKLANFKKVRIQTPIGTDLTFYPREWYVVPIKPDNDIKNGLLPAGQLYTTPIETKTSGTIVIDRCISEFPIDFKDIIQFPKIETELKLEIEKGRIVKIEGDTEADFLKEKCLARVDYNGYTLGEITFGTNPSQSIENNIAIQEVLRDTIHFGFGLNTHLGGDIVSNVHWDAVIEFDHDKIEYY
ncbi:MAG: aminopeptidase [Candidatus Heimdallarchaeota archaeon]|nr:aminopeptidase [Candidatus Heimdallarchaeota archaeon]MCK4771174.1 aminopeptidase [Candidatus Heimdallarchaeota archaeon]